MATKLGLVSPRALSDMNVDTGLLQKRWMDNMLFMESLQPDPLINSPELTQTVEVGLRDVITMPDSIFVDVTPKDDKGKASRTIELIFMSSFDMDPIEGNTQFIGNEGQIELKYTSIQANDWAGGITEDTFGIDFRELDVYGAYDKIRPGLGRWLGEVRALYARQALCQRISQNQTSAPVSATQGISHNWYVPSRSTAAQPAYDSTTADHVNLIGIELDAADTNAVLTVPEILKMNQHVQDSYLEPVMIEGTPMYVLLASPTVIRRLRDPSVSNSWGAYYNLVGSTDNIRKVVPGAQFVIDDRVVVVKDQRSPTLTAAGAGSSWTFTFGYLKYGRSTSRTSSTGAGFYDVNILLGKGALVKYEPEAPHFETQPDEYTKFRGNGLFGAVGYTAPTWDLDSADQTDASGQQESSWLVPTVRS